ncbi:type II toxin-antitoxin system VapB family antitoxin [Rhodoferax sp.]|uniref:type II toxin-antitoxin system VapB family antitoxin n=1 Tax=Rhodoferax sp. TaxID=50421 RepID=UPI00260D773A|nr:type II toxin-antitoxin system VapB family antitoxin [Rhodoferax sp.]MDD5479996.1 type II toxin-antitoxin system VapB family antitoxin [Rhodoferax sp.]
MATNLALNDDLIEEARQLGGHRTKKEVVTQALLEYVQRRRQAGLIDLFGTIEFDDALDAKAQRHVARTPLAD